MKLHNSSVGPSISPIPAQTNGEVRCAIYTRKSTDEGLDSEFNSLDAQREYCEKYIELQKYKGWCALPTAYDDGDCSGGNIDRPALRQLMEHVKDGLVDIVVVHRFDRLSRCSLDFGQVNAELKRYRVVVASVTEQFDTNTASGRLSVRNMVNHAEFMRENSIELTMAKIAATKQKGMWAGGPVPLGYSAVDKKLVINEPEAEIIRLMFGEFIKRKSIKRVVALLREKGIKTKQRLYKNKKTGHKRTVGGHYFDPQALYFVIHNPIYNGKVSHKGKIYPGQHQAIISDDVWNAAHGIFQVNSHDRSGSTRREESAVTSPLRGLLKCGCCGGPMTPAYTKKKGRDKKASAKIFRYYVDSYQAKGRSSGCWIRQISAPEIEGAVLARLQRMFQEPEVLVAAWRNVNAGLAAEVGGGDSNSGGKARASKVSTSKTSKHSGASSSNAIATNVSEDQLREVLSDINAIWDKLFPKEQERLLHTMLEKVVLRKDSIELGIKMDGLMALVQQTGSAGQSSVQDQAAQSSASQSSASQGSASQSSAHLPATCNAGTASATLSGTVLTINVPFQMKQNGRRKLIALPEGAGCVKPKRKPDKTLVKALANAYKWQKLIDDGKFRSGKVLAKKLGMDSSDVYKVLRMNRLAPQIRRAILDGTQPREMNLAMVMKKAWPGDWEGQAVLFGFVAGVGLGGSESKGLAVRVA